MITIKSIRRGFANNSSSSHSIILVSDDVINDITEETEEFTYGWDFFTVKSREEKEKYLFTNLVSCLRRHIRIDTQILSYEAKDKLEREASATYIREHGQLLPFKNLEQMVKAFLEADSYDMYVDHQSVLSIPLDEDGKMNIEFYADFCKEILDNNYLILGGNDNTSADHHFASLNIGVSEIVNMMM